KRGAGCRAAIARKVRGSVTCKSADVSVSIHLADAIVVPVHDVEVAGAVHGQIGVNTNPGADGWPAITGEDQGSVAGYRADDALGITGRQDRQRSERQSRDCFHKASPLPRYCCTVRIVPAGDRIPPMLA